jgi:antitoxin (DNA-binding transcriptional repressor) of toxin-antitoxin stability system
MTIINISEAKTHLSAYTKRIKQGETIILADRNKPFAEIRPLSTIPTAAKKIKLGLLSDLVGPLDDFFTSDKEIESAFLSSSLFPDEK